MIVWIDGDLRDMATARIDPRDRGFTLGDGIYETIRVQNRRILRLDRHFTRMAAGLNLLEFPPVLDKPGLERAMQAALDANGLTDAALRLTVTRGPAARGLAPDPAARPTLAIAAAPYASPAPVSVAIATVTRRNEHSPLARVKSTNCLDAILAKMEAAKRGADDAILLNTAGRVAEATAANLFAIIGGKLCTPPIADGALPGIMRAEIIERLGAEERSLSSGDLMAADEIFLSSSLGIRPVAAIDGHKLPHAHAGAERAALIDEPNPAP